MVDYIGLAGLIIGILAAVGGCVAALHIKLKSNCCEGCQLECADNPSSRRGSPPRSPVISMPKDLRKIEDTTLHSVA